MPELATDKFHLITPQRRMLLPAVVAGLIATGLYLSTLMLTVGSCSHEYCVDAGEFQVALVEWGTAHHTGYPLYMLLGSPFVTMLHWVGIPPSTGASAYSLLWEVLAVAGITLLVGRLTHKTWLALGAGVLFAILRPIWMHGSIPEVYSLSMALSVAIVWVVLDLNEQWSDGKGWLLAFLCGLGVAHHRLIALLLAPVGLYLLPLAWRKQMFWRWFGLAIILFLAGFIPYLDMPLRIWRGTTWHYGSPDTWDGFRFIFLGGEVADLQKPSFDLGLLVSATKDVFHLLRAEFTLPGLAIVTLSSGVALATRPLRSVLRVLAGALVCYLLFAILFPNAVLLDAVLMFPLMALIILMGVGLHTLPGRWHIPISLAVCAWGAFLASRNYPEIYQLTRDPGSVIYINQVEQLEAPPGAVVMAPWGARYFALAYAQRVERRMMQWDIVDHRANFRELAQATGGRIYTAAETLYVFNADWWASRLGSPLRITSAGPGLLALSAQPLEPVTGPVLPIGDGLALVRWEVRPLDRGDQVDVILYWTATGVPTTDYSSFIHVTDQDEIVSAHDLIAQSDYASPVYGWYPTSRWQPKEIVREDHLVTLPPDRPAQTIFCGMYARDADGQFLQLGRIALVIDRNGQWTTR